MVTKTGILAARIVMTTTRTSTLARLSYVEMASTITAMVRLTKRVVVRRHQERNQAKKEEGNLMVVHRVMSVLWVMVTEETLART
jgi:hypothetical protein